MRNFSLYYVLPDTRVNAPSEIISMNWSAQIEQSIIKKDMR